MYTNMVWQVLVIALFKAVQLAHAITISGSGDYIIPNTCYELTCSFDAFKNARITAYTIVDKDNIGIASYSMRYVNDSGYCTYRTPEWTLCSSDVCSCDGDGMATHFCHNHTSYVTGILTISCFDGTASQMKIPVAEGPGSSLKLSPPNTSVIKVIGESLIVNCSADCEPSCQFNWSKDSVAVSSGPTLQITKLSKDDNGTYTCRAGNGYFSPTMLSLFLTVNYGPKTVTLSPSYAQYNVTEGNNIPPIYCTADCRPVCKYNWIGPNGPAGSTNVLNLTNIQKNEKGFFYCIAYNDVGNVTSYNVEVNVQFGPASSLQFEPNDTSVSKTKGDQLGPVNCSAFCNPPCQFKWTKEDITISLVSQLFINPLKIADHGQFKCTASNYLGSQDKSLDVEVNYGPQYVHLIPNDTQYTVTEGTNISPINCTSDCRPTCKYKWCGPNGPYGTTNVLRLQNIQRNQSGVFNCTAYNYVDSLKSSDVNVDVEFGPASSLQFNPNKTSVTKIKGENLDPIECFATCNPPCDYKWTKPDGKIISNDGVLTLRNVTINDHGLLVCTAYNGIGDSQNKSLFLNVNYGPVDVILSPPTNQYTVTHGDNVTVINCTADCRPECNFMWFGPNVPSDTSNVLNIQNVQKNQRGNFSCTASNAVGRMQSSGVNVNVQYEPFINNISINGSKYTVSENTTVTLSCKIDGNPKPQNTWKKNSTIINGGQENNGYSFHTIQKARCIDNGNYSCIANNSLGMASAQQSLYVTCSPRLNLHVEQPKTKIGLPKGSNLLLTVHLLAYPKPESSVWIFNDTKGNESVLSANLETYELFKHAAVLSKTNLTLYDFGDYILKVNNTLGLASQIYHVVPQGPPDPSTILNVTCGVQTAVVYWMISFNGGETQNFSIIINKNGNAIYVHDTGISDEDEVQTKYARIKLKTGKYFFIVNGKNNYGNRNSTASTNCQVKEIIMSDSDSVVGAAAGGGVAAAIVIILAIVLLLFIKNRRRPKGDDGRRNLTTEEKDDDDGLTENPLYISSGETANDSGILYSVVNKKGKTDIADKTGNQGPVYSEVHKKDGKGKHTTGKKNMNKIEKSGNAGKDIEMGSVYENSRNLKNNVDSDDVYANTVQNGTTDNIYQPTKNKDGLIYADLDLAPCVGGHRFVIRGLENRSNYAIIDLTKTAEPLPSDDDEDEQKSSKTIQDKADGE